MGGAERKEQKASTGGGFEWKKPWNKFSKAVNILEKKKGGGEKRIADRRSARILSRTKDRDVI
jgi:hypothetical protein